MQCFDNLFRKYREVEIVGFEGGTEHELSKSNN